MKKVYIVLIVGVLGLLSACDTEEPVPVQGATLPAVEMGITSVVSVGDYQAAKKGAWVVYTETKAKNFTQYTDAKSAAFRVWQAVDQDELKTLRDVDRENYLKWLDANKINDFGAQHELETSVPAIIAYRSKSGEAYKVYETLKGAAYQAWENTNAQAYQAYEISIAKSYEAYESHKQAVDVHPDIPETRE